MKRLLSIAIICCLALPGCKNVPNTQQQVAQYEEGRFLRIGWATYKVYFNGWGTIEPEGINQPYLAVALLLRNEDSEPHPIPDMLLVDNDRTKYAANWSYYPDPYFFVGRNIEPGQTSVGLVCFDVPTDRTYSIRLSGGEGERNCALVALKLHPY